jgi:hypothetical protein
LGLVGNDIKIGIYFPTETPNVSKQFEFGTVREEMQFCSVDAISMDLLVYVG